MEKKEIISAEECCTHYNIEFSFISSLDEEDLSRWKKWMKKYLFTRMNCQAWKRYMHLHYDLEINLEGLEAITSFVGTGTDPAATIDSAAKQVTGEMTIACN